MLTGYIIEKYTSLKSLLHQTIAGVGTRHAAVFFDNVSC